MIPPIGARQQSNFIAVCDYPDVCLTPAGSSMVPVPYMIIVPDLSPSVGVAKSVRFNGHPAYLLDSSSTPGVTGDESGTGGGVISGTHVASIYPIEATKSVRIEGKRVVRDGDRCRMNHP